MEGQYVFTRNDSEALGSPGGDVHAPRKRPRRQAAIDAIDKIHDVLNWEGCKENSEMFKLVRERINQEFERGRPLEVEDDDDDEAEVEEIGDDEEEDDESEVGSLVNFVKDDDSEIEYDTGASVCDEEEEADFSDEEEASICTDDLVSEGDDNANPREEEV